MMKLLVGRLGHIGLVLLMAGCDGIAGILNREGPQSGENYGFALIYGYVRTNDGGPVAGASVQVASDVPGRCPAREGLVTGNTLPPVPTDARGFYRTEVVSPAEVDPAASSCVRIYVQTREGSGLQSTSQSAGPVQFRCYRLIQGGRASLDSLRVDVTVSRRD